MGPDARSRKMESLMSRCMVRAAVLFALLWPAACGPDRGAPHAGPGAEGAHPRRSSTLLAEAWRSSSSTIPPPFPI